MIIRCNYTVWASKLSLPGGSVEKVVSMSSLTKTDLKINKSCCPLVQMTVSPWSCMFSMSVYMNEVLFTPLFLIKCNHHHHHRHHHLTAHFKKKGFWIFVTLWMTYFGETRKANKPFVDFLLGSLLSKPPAVSRQQHWIILFSPPFGLDRYGLGPCCRTPLSLCPCSTEHVTLPVGYSAGCCLRSPLCSPYTSSLHLFLSLLAISLSAADSLLCSGCG